MTHSTDNRALWELVEASRAIVSAYRGMPDGELGKGLVNGHFLRIEDALKLFDTEAILERPVVVGGWLPIESAPKDRMIMLGRPADDEREGISLPGFWNEALEDGVDYMGNDEGFVDCMFQTFYCGRSFGQPRYQNGGFQPTHWRELHAAPETNESMVMGKS